MKNRSGSGIEVRRFGFVNHFPDLRTLYEILPWPLLRKLPPITVKSFISRIPAFKLLEIGPINSISGDTANGIGVLCPLLPEHFVTLNPATVLKKILASVHVAERYKASLVGLGGFTSVFGNEGEEVAKRVGVAVTSGNTYTATLTIDGVIEATKLMGCDLSACTLAVIGATGDIGSICAKVLSKMVAQVILVARNEKRLEEMRLALTGSSVQITKRVSEAVRNADIVLSAASAITTIIESEELKPGAIVCDVGYPANVAPDILQKRDDVFVFEGGMATWDRCGDMQKTTRQLYRFSPAGTTHGCLAETMVLALERRYENYSLGRGNITEERINEIRRLAQKHGFRLAPFHYRRYFYGPEQINQLRLNATRKRKEPCSTSLTPKPY